jgi:hypothetical protein
MRGLHLQYGPSSEPETSDLLDTNACLGTIKLAVARLPEKLRERYAEEWQSHVNEVPGVIGKVFDAARFSLAADKMVRIERHTNEAESWRQKVAQLEDLQSRMSTVADALNAIRDLKELASNRVTLTSNAALLTGLRAGLKNGTKN